MARSLRRMAKTWGGAVYSFSPETFILPREADELAAAMQKASSSAADAAASPVVWICKPSASSQGKNIFLITSLAELSYDCSFVVQRYIANPMLIGGYKYDLRIYVLVTSFRPLNVFLYREGLVRFSSSKYNNDLTNLFAHLTNASINKHSPDLEADKDVIGQGCKWTIRTRWFDYLERACGVNPYMIWEQIKELVLLTLLPIVSEVPDNPRSFELLGFDVMLDSNFKPWLIEVNASPALAISGAEDTAVKIPMLNDLITAIGFPAPLCEGLHANTSNVLTPNQTGFDLKAKQKARTAAIASAQAAAATAAAAAAAAAASDDATATPAAAAPPRNANVQRIPRLVKLQSLGSTQSASRGASATTAAPATAAAPSFAAHSPRTRRAAHDTKDSLIPRMPSQSPPRALSSSPPAAATPSRIPLRTTPSDAAAAPAIRAGVTRAKPSSAKAQPASNSMGGTVDGAGSSATAAVAAARRSAARQSSADPKLAPSSASASAAARLRTKPSPAASSSATIGAAPSAPISASASAPSSSPALIGDFERIFPFDAATTAASEALAPVASSAAGGAAAAGARGSKGASSASQPLALLLGSFARAVVTGIKTRSRDRERTAAARARARESDPSLSLRQSFVPSSDVPSPWTSEALAAAVAAARAAAKAERARLGLPEPTLGQDAEANEESDALQLEDESDAAEPFSKPDDAEAATGPAAAAAAAAADSSSNPASPTEKEEKQPEPIAAEC